MGKNLKGGYQVIDLRNIDLTLTGESQDITDVEVLEQLATLRDYIEPSHNYAKPLKKKLKPILISIRDKKTDEEQESSVWANLSLNDDELSFKIESVVNNNPLKVLQINVVFELVTEEDGSTHYEIDTAKVLLSELVKMGDINVEGITSKGIANTGALGNIGDVAISGDLSATGDASVGGDLSVTGAINGEENPSVKPIYWHTLKIQRGGTAEEPNYARLFGYVIILNNNPTPFTLNDFLDMLRTQGVSLVLHSGKFSNTGASDLSGMVEATRLVYRNATNFDVEYYSNNTFTIGGELSIGSGWVTFEDIGVNKIN